MQRDTLEKMRDYFAGIQARNENEERFLNELTKELEQPQPKDEPLFWTNNVNAAALVRHGYDPADVTDDAYTEIAGIMGDLYANSRYSEDLIAACDEVGIPMTQ